MNLRLYYKKFRSTIISKWAVLLIDLLIVFFSFSLACFFYFDFHLTVIDISCFGWTALSVIVINTIYFHLLHTYVGVLKYSSFVDISRIFISLLGSYGSIILLNLLLGSLGINGLPYVVILVTYLINILLMSSFRIIAKLLYEVLSIESRHGVNVFIYGVREEGVNIAKEIKISHNSKYRLCGFISDSSDMHGKMMMGHKIYANDEELFDILCVKNVKAIIVSSSKMGKINTSEILDKLAVADVKLLSVPRFNEWRDVISDTVELKQIQIEDLLGRDPIKIDFQKIASNIEGKRIMVTGAAGSIGSEIVRQVAALNPYMLIMVDQAETPLHEIRLELENKWRNLNFISAIADVANWSRMERIFQECTPQYIFHAAAYKHVPMMEENVSEAIQANVQGTKNLADLAMKYKADKFVLVSTDKAVNPTNVMGCSKRIAEIYVQSLAQRLKENGDRSAKFVTTRFGNVLGSNGSVIPRFREQIQKGGPVTVTHPEIIRYFMTIPEACRLVLEAGSMGNGGEIYVFDMGSPVKIIDLAKRMIALSGSKNVKIEYTGLRPGEKLYEELLTEKEQTLTTQHEKIMIAKVRIYEYEIVKKQIQELVKISYGYDSMQIVLAMKEIVPEFISKNSEYEVLDAQKTEILERVI